MTPGTRVFHRQHLGTGTVVATAPDLILGNVAVEWDEHYSWLTWMLKHGVAPWKVKPIPPNGVPSRPDFWNDAEVRRFLDERVNALNA